MLVVTELVEAGAGRRQQHRVTGRAAAAATSRPPPVPDRTYRRRPARAPRASVSAASPIRYDRTTGPAATAAASGANEPPLSEPPRISRTPPRYAVSALITASGLVALESSTNCTPDRSATTCIRWGAGWKQRSAASMPPSTPPTGRRWPRRQRVLEVVLAAQPGRLEVDRVAIGRPNQALSASPGSSASAAPDRRRSAPPGRRAPDSRKPQLAAGVLLDRPVPVEVVGGDVQDHAHAERKVSMSSSWKLESSQAIQAPGRSGPAARTAPGRRCRRPRPPPRRRAASRRSARWWWSCRWCR